MPPVVVLRTKGVMAVCSTSYILLVQIGIALLFILVLLLMMVIIIIIMMMMIMMMIIYSTGESSYASSFPNVFVGVCGTSFYEQCFPSQTIDFGFSSMSVHCLSKKPCDLEDSISYSGGSSDLVKPFKEQAAADWELFLLQRAAELKPGNAGLIKRVIQVLSLVLQSDFLINYLIR